MSRELASSLPPEVARGLAARLRDAAAAADRLADFSFAEHDTVPPPVLRDGEERAVAGDFVGRALHAATDPLGGRILHAAVGDGTPIEELTAATGLPRLAVLERVYELLQLGLVARDLQADTVVATGAGRALDQVVSELADDVSDWLRARRRSE
ncbi:hypothetical protein [Paraconexibacter sp.]|uniref:hypothetical protein n=1 Tax=Paraconexibacter sp. TaxID=2949640 RepID=UPI00356AB9B9